MKERGYLKNGFGEAENEVADFSGSLLLSWQRIQAT